MGIREGRRARHSHPLHVLPLTKYTCCQLFAMQTSAVAAALIGSSSSLGEQTGLGCTLLTCNATISRGVFVRLGHEAVLGFVILILRDV